MTQRDAPVTPRSEQIRLDQNIPTTSKSDSSGHDGKTTKTPQEKAQRPDLCTQEDWAKYLCCSRGFHQDKAIQLGTRAPLTEAKVLDGARALDNLIRVKGHSESEVLAVLGWSIEDPFWSANLRSIKALLKISSSNGDLKFVNVLTAMKRDFERKAMREGV